ncbi:MAG TPA: AI-2E family transporter, partial [Burkholderiaceae bacterium]
MPPPETKPPPAPEPPHPPAQEPAAPRPPAREPAWTPAPAAAPAERLRDHASPVLNFTAVLVLMYFGREVLVPITLAGILSLLLAPLVRRLRRLGLGQVPSVLVAVAGSTLCVLGLAGMIASQVVSMAGSLPQYESTIRDKLETVREVTLGRMQAMQGEAGAMIRRLGDPSPSSPVRAGFGRAPLTADGAVPVEIHERPKTPVEVMSQVFSSVWGPLGKAGIVLVVLVFVLLEHELLRDRFIRLIGGADLRGTTHAFNDAGERLSRFFVSQFAVNVGVGGVVWIGLLLLGLPHALLWAGLTTVLRFVPYVGVFVAAFSAALLAAAVDPGWSMMFSTLGLFGVVEVVAAQAVEPQLYGHSTGLSPLSVVVAAIFWSWIWGPVGLLVSTPLTLCLVVLGRYVKSLAFLDVLLGDSPALTMSERFYQRALSGDAEEIIAAARAYLKRKSFARYCDRILMPALRLAVADFTSGSITGQQQQMVKGAIARVIEALGPAGRRPSRAQRCVSVLDDTNLGEHLRRSRESVSGRYQGPVAVAPGSVALCIGLGSLRDDLVTEILVRILRDLDIDARHLSVADLEGGPPPGATPGGVAMLFVVSAFPREEWARGEAVVAELRSRFGQASIVALLPEQDMPAARASVDLVVDSFEDAAARAAERFPPAARMKAAARKSRKPA